MNGKPKNLSQAIDELGTPGASNGGSDLRDHLERELRRLEDAIHRLKPEFEDLKEKATARAGEAKRQVEDQVVKNPWAALGVVGLIFFVLGFLFGQRGGSRRSD